MKITLLHAGGEPTYLRCLVSGLSRISDLKLNVIDSNKSIGAFDGNPSVEFYNLRGDQNEASPFLIKLGRILKYYFRLAKYALTTDTKLFHIQWYNKFEFFDRTFLNIYYKVLGKKIIFTAHNVNNLKRESRDNILNKLSLRVHYAIVDGIIVHTEQMKRELLTDFGVNENKVTVIPHGINEDVPSTTLSSPQARENFGIPMEKKAILFFGNIDVYKGLDVFADAVSRLPSNEYEVIIAGQIKRPFERMFTQTILPKLKKDNVTLDLRYIDASEIEYYFKAADCIVLPYRDISQTGVIFLAYNFGLPVIATDVGSLKEDIIEGRTGYLCEPNDPVALSEAIVKYFTSDLYENLDRQREQIACWARREYSWDSIGEKTFTFYKRVLESTNGVA